MLTFSAGRTAALVRLVPVALLFAASALAVSCGGSEDCAAVISVNVSPEECESLAARFGCSSFEVDGPTCGLYGCVTCGELNPQSAGR